MLFGNDQHGDQRGFVERSVELVLLVVFLVALIGEQVRRIVLDPHDLATLEDLPAGKKVVARLKLEVKEAVALDACAALTFLHVPEPIALILGPLLCRDLDAIHTIWAAHQVTVAHEPGVFVLEALDGRDFHAGEIELYGFAEYVVVQLVPANLALLQHLLHEDINFIALESWLLRGGAGAAEEKKSEEK